MLTLKGKKIWVTGASSGIGYACALAFAKAGADLAISGRNLERLDALHQKIKQYAPESRVCIEPFDVTDKQANQTAVAHIKAALGGIDIAFLNAGASQHGDVKQFDSNLYEWSMRINYLSVVYGVEAVLPVLRESSSPHLVGMSSVAAYGGLPRGQAYGAAKAATRNFLEGLAIELRAEKMPVSIVCPGFVKTPMTDKNDFHMPFLMSAEKAADIILQGILKQRTEIHFPKRMSVMLKFLNCLPVGLYVRIVSWLSPRA